MQPDYEEIKRVHGVEGRESDSTARRRLTEVRSAPSYVCRATGLQRALRRRSRYMNATEARVLRELPSAGIAIGHYSNAFLYSPALTRLPTLEHRSLVSLVFLGRIVVVEGRDERGEQQEILAPLVTSTYGRNPYRFQLSRREQ